VPATIPSHQAAVLPLKLRWPRRFDGVALVIGSMAPDFPYVLDGTGLDLPSHALHSLLWYAVPVTLVVTALVRWAAPVVAAHLPDLGSLALRDYGVLGAVRHPVLVTAYSGVVGALTHIGWDAFTHPIVIALHPWHGGRSVLPFLHGLVAGEPWWWVLRVASDVAGVLAVAGMVVHIGARRLLVAWHGPAPVVPRRPVVFWATATLVGATALGAVAVLGRDGVGVHVLGNRIIGALALAILAAAALARERAPAIA
jgi:hypothetical protein